MSASTKASKAIVPFQQEFPTWECDVKNDPIRLLESEKKNLTPTLTVVNTFAASIRTYRTWISGKKTGIFQLTYQLHGQLC